MIISRKNTLKDESPVIIEKDVIRPGEYGISSDRKIKDHKKVSFYKNVPIFLCTFMETFIGVFIHCFPMKKKPQKLMYRNQFSTLSHMVGKILQSRIFNALLHSARRCCTSGCA